MVTRRQFLQTAGVAGSAGLLVVAGVSIPVLHVAGQGAPSPSAPTPQPPTPPGPVTQSLDSPGPGKAAPGALTGTVVMRDGDLLYLSTPEGDRVVHLTNASLIWKGGEVTAAALNKGDVVQVTGVVLADGTVAAVFVEANIAQVRGVVTEVLADGWQVADRAGALKRVVFDNSWLPEVVQRGVPADPRQLRVVARDTAVMVIGLLLADGSVRATKVFIG